MRADVNLDPDALRTVTRVVAGLVDDLFPLLDRLPDVPVGGPERSLLLAEHARLRSTVARVAAELSALHGAARAAATAAERADEGLARELRRHAAGGR
jgi:hypothetical protein